MMINNYCFYHSLRYLVIIISSFFVIQTSYTNAQWQQVNVGSSGRINVVANIGGSEVLAGTTGGIYKSTDNGTSWINVGSYFTLCFAVNGANIFAGTGTGIIVSTDQGMTWKNPDNYMNFYITSLTVNNNYIFAGTYQDGIYRSSDNGTSWIAVNNGLGSFQYLVNSLVKCYTTLFAGTASGLCYSTNNGDNWSTVSSLSNLLMVNCLAVKDSTIFLGTTGSIYKSTDEGKSWNGTSNGLPGTPNAPAIFSISPNSTYTYLGTDNGVYISTDGGDNWVKENNGIPSTSTIYSITESNSNVLAGTDFGIYSSTNGDTNWAASSNGITNSKITFIVGSGQSIFIVENYSTIYSSNNNGTTWTLADSGLGNEFIECLTLNNQNIYAVTNNGIYTSTDNGNYWNQINGGVMDTVNPTYLVISGSNLVVSTQNDGIFYSTNNGANWMSSVGNLNIIDALSKVGSYLIAADNNNIYFSSNDGENWNNVNDTLEHITNFASIGMTLFSARHTWPTPIFEPPSPPGGVFNSNDNGVNWTDITANLPNDPQVYTLTTNDSLIFVGLDPGIYYKTVKGDNWINASSGIPILTVQSIFINNDYVYAGFDNGGLWQKPLSDFITGIPKLKDNLPSNFLLMQNFPNPFNPSTIIQYQIPESGLVTLKVYDILGREVKTLINQYQKEGKYKIKFMSNNLASGVYFYRLTEGHFSDIKKLVLIK